MSYQMGVRFRQGTARESVTATASLVYRRKRPPSDTIARLDTCRRVGMNIGRGEFMMPDLGRKSRARWAFVFGRQFFKRLAMLDLLGPPQCSPPRFASRCSPVCFPAYGPAGGVMNMAGDGPGGLGRWG